MFSAMCLVWFVITGALIGGAAGWVTGLTVFVGEERRKPAMAFTASSCVAFIATCVFRYHYGAPLDWLAVPPIFVGTMAMTILPFKFLWRFANTAAEINDSRPSRKTAGQIRHEDMTMSAVTGMGAGAFVGMVTSVVTVVHFGLAAFGLAPIFAVLMTVPALGSLVGILSIVMPLLVLVMRAVKTIGWLAKRALASLE